MEFFHVETMSKTDREAMTRISPIAMGIIRVEKLRQKVPFVLAQSPARIPQVIDLEIFHLYRHVVCTYP